MIYVFDIDGTICTIVEEASYQNAQPLESRIQKVNKLYEEGNIIKLFTARGTQTGIDWTEITIKQLKEWSVKYHELIMNKKPHGDLYIDDKAINANSFFN